MRHRVRHGDELDIERADPAALAVAHGDQLGAVEKACLLDAMTREPERQRGPVDREAEIAQQERQSADVVFVPVGGDAPVDATGVLAQVREVRQHEVDAEHVDVGEHQPDVEQHDAAIHLDAGAVAPDLSEPAQERDDDGVRHEGASTPPGRGPR